MKDCTCGFTGEIVCDNCKLDEYEARSRTRLIVGNILIIESDEWGVSICGPNPEIKDYFGVVDYETAQRLVSLLVSEAHISRPVNCII